MKTFTLVVAAAVAAAGLQFAPLDADAARIGRGKPAGMQRQAPAQAAPSQQNGVPPQQQAQPGPAAAPQPSGAAQQPAAAAARTAPAAAAAQQPARNRWLAPVAGLAAGLGIAALASHFGFGEALANFMTVMLLVIVGFIAIRFLMRRFGGGSARPAAAGAGTGGNVNLSHRDSAGPAWGASPSNAATSSRTMAAGGSGAAASALPADFDADGFERIAKLLFVRLQDANDAGRLDELRRYTTPQLYATLQHDIDERGNVIQRTDVLKLDARVEDAVVENGQSIVSVRFTGLTRENGADSMAEPFDESWHFVRPADGSREWAIAGITPNA